MRWRAADGAADRCGSIASKSDEANLGRTIEAGAKGGRSRARLRRRVGQEGGDARATECAQRRPSAAPMQASESCARGHASCSRPVVLDDQLRAASAHKTLSSRCVKKKTTPSAECFSREPGPCVIIFLGPSMQDTTSGSSVLSRLADAAGKWWVWMALVWLIYSN